MVHSYFAKAGYKCNELVKRIIMKTILDVGYGKDTLHELYMTGQMSSRLLYGMEEIRKDGSFLVKECSFSDQGGIKGFLYNNIKVLRSSDIIFMSYIYEGPLLLLAILKKIGFFKKRRVVGVSHTTIHLSNKWLFHIFDKWIYDIFDMVLFHSRKNMDESIQYGNVKPAQADFLYWGDDLDFVDNHFLQKPFSNYFISTGRENRNYKTLIEAFANENYQLRIYTNRCVYENRYDYLDSMKDKYSNVQIEMVDKSNSTTLYLAEKTANCCCVVIPLIQEKINYCLGLTSVVEAMAYGKPIISSVNPYSPIDIEKERIGFVARDVEEWKNAIRYIGENVDEAREMGKRARKLAEEIYNMKHCANQLKEIFDKF